MEKRTLGFILAEDHQGVEPLFQSQNPKIFLEAMSMIRKELN
jgi:hypothetical protein